jgi:hypothetical protein
MLARMVRLLPLLLLALPASANEVPPCDARRAGAVACLSGRLCECRLDRGGSITGLSTGFRWNCGIRRPSCAVLRGSGAAAARAGAATGPPAPAAAAPHPLAALSPFVLDAGRDKPGERRT